MKLYVMGWFLSVFGGIGAITLAPIGIYFREQWYISNKTIVNHEKIHWKQQTEMIVAGSIISILTVGILMLCNIFSWWLLMLILFPFLFFYIWYLIEWALKAILPPKGAYIDLSTEREAYLYEQDLTYLNRRKHFTWMKYIFKEP